MGIEDTVRQLEYEIQNENRKNIIESYESNLS